jgi:ABC-type cobalamin/Fe3+-siderophores transport system ATPase subunit
VIGAGPPREALTADVLERTYGAPMAIIEHAGMPVVLDHHHGDDNVVALRRPGA